ncbi:hypothetical protein D3C72_1789050 [compost metagenome]
MRRQLQGIGERRQKLQELACPAHTGRGLDVEACQQSAPHANQHSVIARHHHATDQPTEHRQGTDDQQPRHVLAEMLEQGVNQDCAQCAEEKQQIAQLIHGKYRAAPGRSHAVARQQRHDGQWPAAATRRGAIGEFGGHHHAEAF